MSSKQNHEQGSKMQNGGEGEWSYSMLYGGSRGRRAARGGRGSVLSSVCEAGVVVHGTAGRQAGDAGRGAQRRRAVWIAAGVGGVASGVTLPPAVMLPSVAVAEPVQTTVVVGPIVHGSGYVQSATGV
jgi:hypothetical protein